jgi:zinc protease
MRLSRLPLLALPILLNACGGSPSDEAATSAATAPAAIEQVTSVEGITEYRLSNGLKVLLFPDPASATVTVNMTYLVGSVDESYGETGMAHLLEHMLFKGTPKHPDPLKELQDMGANMNGSTSWERTNYYETLEGSDANLVWALEFEADRMINADVAQADLDSEMTVVRNEFEDGENSPIGVLYERVLSTAYLWHSYGKSPIGSRSDIENVPIDRLQAFYRKHYQPDNAVLVVAGKIEEQRTLDLIVEHFGPIPRPDRELTDHYTEEPTQDGERVVSLSRVGDLPTVIAAYHAPDGTHEDFVPLQVAAGVLADVPSGRLYRSLVESGLATDIGSDQMQLRDPGMVLFLAITRADGDIGRVREVMLETIDDLETSPITAEEVDRIRNQSLSGIERLLNNSQAVALQLSEWASIGDWRMFFLDRDRVRTVTPEQAQAAALRYFKPSNRTVGVFTPTTAPDRSEIPERPDLVAMLDGYTGDAGRSVGEAFDPTPANIDARTVRRSLPGGIEIAMLPKENRGDRVNATIRLHYGDLDSLTGLSTTASLTGSMLMRGTTTRTRQEIEDELARLQSVLNVSGGAGTFSATMQSTRENLPAVLEMAFDILRNPSFPAEEFATLKDNQIASIDSQRSEPDSIASLELSRHLGQNYERGDPRYTETFDEAIEEINAVELADLRQFHQDFLGASNAHVVFVGDFDAEAFVTAIEAGLGGWQSPRPYTQIVSPYPDPVPAVVNRSFDTPDKENAIFLAALPIRMNNDDEDYPAMVLASYILGDGAGSRLFARIREREGLSYGAYASFGAPSLSDGAMHNAQAIAAPQNVAQVEASFRDEMTTILRDGYSAEEIELGKRSWAQNRQVGRSQDGSLVGQIESHMHYGRTMQWDADLEARVQALTPEQVLEVMQRHINVDAMTIMKGGDF